MKPLVMLFLIAATAAAAPITALYTCVINTGQMIATGGIAANFGGDAFCESVVSPSRINASMAFNSGVGNINSYRLGGFMLGNILTLNAVFDLDPFGNAAVGFFSVSRVVAEGSAVSLPVSETAFRLDVAGTYTRLTPVYLGETRISFLFNTDTPEPGAGALYSIGLIGVLVCRRWGRSGRAQRSS